MADISSFASTYYPPVGFHFRVEFQGVNGLETVDTYWREVTGLSVDIETESVKSGGENRFTYELPTRAKYPNLVLKRGLITNSALIDWVREAVDTLEIKELANVVVTLLNENHEPLQAYRCVNAWPKKWAVSDFNAEDSQLVIETLELVYQYYTIQ